MREIVASVLAALEADAARRFSWADVAFFMRWWREDASDDDRARARRLVAEGRLDFVNGGAVQHDEAGAHFMGMIDQMALGHRFLNATFGFAPTVGWQVDPFGEC